MISADSRGFKYPQDVFFHSVSGSYRDTRYLSRTAYAVREFPCYSVLFPCSYSLTPVLIAHNNPRRGHNTRSASFALMLIFAMSGNWQVRTLPRSLSLLFAGQTFSRPGHAVIRSLFLKFWGKHPKRGHHGLTYCKYSFL